jgi:amino acid adenylation domain-containing protein/non-ribosomal peptide synthase protein (TIGR01720 family)
MIQEELIKRIETLSPEQRALLFQQLQEQKEPAPAAHSPIPRQPRVSNTWPVSVAQQRLWFLDRYEPDSPLYNIPAGCSIEGDLDAACLERALETIVARHEILRTTFTTIDDEVVQIVGGAGRVDLAFHDLSDHPRPDRAAEAQEIMAQEAQRPFDLTYGPLLRALLIQIAEQEHVLFWNIHHIAYDGWSQGIFLRELAALYHAYANGQASPLAELPIQYLDYAAWQRQWLQGELLERQIDYWRRQLAGVAALELPTDRPRPPVRTPHGTMQTRLFPQPLLASLKELTRQEGATLFMTMLAAFQALLHHYTQSEDIAVGTMIANRNRDEIEGLIGFFANTLTLRTDLSGNPTFRELLRRVREVTLGAYDHQDVPFEKLVEELNPPRDLSRTPLFQVMLILQNTPAGLLELSDVTLRPIEADSRTAKFDLSLYLTEADEGIYAAMEYNTDLFNAATIQRMLGCLETLLEAVAAAPELRLADLPLLGGAELEQVLVTWNATQLAYPQHMCIHELFEAQAALTPQATALIVGGQRLTYAELNQRSNRLARHLRSLGVGAEVRVGLSVERSLEMVVGLLGILKAGAAYVPLDPAYPQERLAFMVEDARVSVLLTATNDQRPTTNDQRQGDKETRRQGDEWAADDPSSILHPPSSILDLRADWESIAQEPDENLPSAAQAENLAYVIYTSGSTGKPKGVQISHRAVVNFLCSMRRQLELSDQDVLLAVTSISFDIAGLELFLPLMSGAKLVLADQETTSDGFKLGRLLIASGATIMQATPATWQLLLEAGWQGDGGLRVLCGGEALRPELAQELLARSSAVWNLYGPTEATIWSTIAQVKDRAVTIGRPIANTQIHVLDPHLRAVPIGVWGELYIGGDGLARGYRNRPDLTAERFVPNPFLKDEGRRMKDESASFILHPSSFILYRTGDLARYRADGNLECAGRLDHQVKVRGFRIELGEIETVLGRHAAVQRAVVLAREDTPGDVRLVAYIVADQRPTTNDQRQGDKETRRQGDSDYATLNTQYETPSSILHPPSSILGELRAFLQTKLPAYMIPALFVVLESMPLTPNGKLDRRALPAPQSDRPLLRAEFVAPRTPSEQVLAAIWERVLKLDRIGIHDNFFNLGGDSLLIMRVVFQAKQNGIEITPKQVFQHPTVAELAEAAGKLPILAEQAAVTGPVIMTPFQRYFFEELRPEKIYYYTMAPVLTAEEPFDPAYVQQVLKELLRHHDALRLSLHGSAPDWELFNAGPSEEVPFRLVDVPGLTEEDFIGQVREIYIELMESIDMARGPLFQAALLDPGHGKPNYLMLVGHYLPLDIEAWRVLIEDFATAYGQLARGDVIRMLPKTTSLQQWSQRLFEYAQSQEALRELPYWLSEPQTAPARLPVDHPEGQNSFGSTRLVVAGLTAQETLQLMQLARSARDLQVDDLLLTTFTLTLARWTGSHTLPVDLISHGREPLFEDIDLSRTIGWMSIIYPVLFEVEAGADLSAALQSIAEQRRRIAHNGLGYCLLRYYRRDAEIVEKLRARPLPEVYFNYMGPVTPQSSELRQVVLMGGYVCDTAPRRAHLIEVNANVRADGALYFDWAYSEQVHDAATIEQLAEQYLRTLRLLMDIAPVVSRQ